MNCSSVRNRLLALADPAAVPDRLSTHLDGCPACQGWHRLLIEVEGVVAGTPVPESDGRSRKNLLAQFRDNVSVNGKPVTPTTAKPRPKPSAPVTPAPPGRISVGDRLARLWPAGIAAAALLLGTVLWISLGRKSVDEQAVANLPADPFLERVVRAKVSLDTAATAPERLKVLDGLGADLHDQAQALALVTPGEMSSIAGMYEIVVGEALVEQARLLGADERRDLLDKYIQRLSDTEQLANRKAAEGVPVGSNEQLQRIARAAAQTRVALSKMRGA
jgi:hypothetical protein